MAPVTSRHAIIIGAGPAGITAAYELATRTDIVPVVLERSGYVGGLARTHEFQGNRIDMGGHRFFSKSDRVLDWWFNILPLQRCDANAITLRYQNRSRHVQGARDGPDPDIEDRVMLLRGRKSSILFDRKLFPYPLRLTPSVLRKLGLQRMARIGLSYLRRAISPVRPVENLEHFLINRFGDALYHTFFESYTEKVWGMPCHAISAEWGAQRIKDLSVAKALGHWLRGQLRLARHDAAQTSTSLAENFLYPKFGPGQLWEEAAQRVKERGGVLLHHRRVTGLALAGNRITEVRAVNLQTGETERFTPDFVFSSMPVSEVVAGLDPAPPDAVREVAQGLCYRDFITVGMCVRELRLHEGAAKGPLTDSWLYVQEPDVKLGRLQIYNNWSRYMVARPDHYWLGLEYFCTRDDAVWRLSDEAILDLASKELARLGAVVPGDVLDGVVVRVEKAYPAYWGAYSRFDEIRAYLDPVENLFLVGRNGMHKYNNQDHSMLTAMKAVDNIIAGQTDKANVWNVNTEGEYLEELGEGD